MKINFTADHYAALKNLACEMLFKNEEIRNKFGVPLSIVELLHTTTINQLNEIKNILSKKIEENESRDEWVGPDSEKLASLRNKRELVHLIIGWKRYNLELQENENKREELTERLEALKESQKTPEERISEIEKQLAELETL